MASCTEVEYVHSGIVAVIAEAVQAAGRLGSKSASVESEQDFEVFESDPAGLLASEEAGFVDIGLVHLLQIVDIAVVVGFGYMADLAGVAESVEVVGFGHIAGSAGDIESVVLAASAQSVEPVVAAGIAELQLKAPSVGLHFLNPTSESSTLLGMLDILYNLCCGTLRVEALLELLSRVGSGLR
jgi:hypothetical protein